MFATCQPGEAPDYVNDTFGQPGHVKCCRGGQCGHGAVYLDTWPSVTQVSGDTGDRGLMCAVTRCMTYTAAAASWSSMRRESLLVKGGLRSGGLIFE